MENRQVKSDQEENKENSIDEILSLLDALHGVNKMIELHEKNGEAGKRSLLQFKKIKEGYVNQLASLLKGNFNLTLTTAVD